MDPTSTPAFSICVPTFNRGRRARQLVEEVLPQLRPDWSLVLFDNGSTAESDEYQTIAALAVANPGRLVYHRNPQNLGFHGNIMRCVRDVEAPLIMLLSDEDRPHFEGIAKALGLVATHPELGVVRGGITPLVPGATPANSITFQDLVMTRGADALTRYGLMNNYFSGVIYNRALMQRLGLIDRLAAKLRDNQDYPHLYLEALTCAVSEVATCAEHSCREGAAQTVAGGPDSDRYAPPYSLGARMDQFMGMRNCLHEAVGLLADGFDSTLFTQLYVNHSSKFMRLVARVNAPMYAANHIDVPVAVRSFAIFACAAGIAVPEMQAQRGALVQALEQMSKQFTGT